MVSWPLYDIASELHPDLHKYCQGAGGVSVKSGKSANALCEVCSKPANFLCRFQSNINYMRLIKATLLVYDFKHQIWCVSNPFYLYQQQKIGLSSKLWVGGGQES